MYITFFGAAGEVTGSSSLLEAGGRRILVDCGMFQGDSSKEAKNHIDLPFDPKQLTDVIVTHAHLDHVGRLPLLIKGGFQGHIYTTPPTAELAKLILEDALEVMFYNNRRDGSPILYDDTDIANTVGKFKPIEYEEEVALGDVGAMKQEKKNSRLSLLGKVLSKELKTKAKSGNVSFTFHEAGHIFGSAFVEINAENKKVVFSGDVGNINVPILRDTAKIPDDLDVLICESTYGDRLHEQQLTRQQLIERMVVEAIKKGGTLVIPSFALERTQELIYDLNDLVERKKALPRIPIFLDSPLAIDTMKVYRKYPKYYDEEADRYFKSGDDLFGFPGLTMCYTREESKRINNTAGSKIIIAGAGMMNGGRVVHHALRYLSDAKNTLLIIGYQTPGTLGRKILDGQSPVEILGERVTVRCNIRQIGALSAHGDQKKLMSWITNDGKQPKRVFLNHGDPKASLALATKLKTENDTNVEIAAIGKRFEL